MTTPTIDVGNLVALKCTVVSMTVPEKTRHRKYAAEALAATIEFFNALHESKKVDITMCRADYVHGSTRSFIFEVPAGDADDIALTISEDLTFETVDNVGSYTLGMPTRYSEAQESANHATSMWRGYLKCPAGWLHAPDHFSTQINQHFNRAGLNVEKIAVLRDKEYGVATSDYAIEFTPQAHLAARQVHRSMRGSDGCPSGFLYGMPPPMRSAPPNLEHRETTPDSDSLAVSTPKTTPDSGSVSVSTPKS